MRLAYELMSLPPQPSLPDSPPRSDHFWSAITLLGLLVGISTRFICLSWQSLWFDEGYTAWMISHSPAEIIRLTRADTTPPLYYLLLHEWTRCFGHSEAALRSLSALFTALTLLLFWQIARRLLVRPPAVASAVWALALGFHQQNYAQEARAYALMGLIVVALFDLLQRHLAADHRRWLLPIALLTAAAMYTHNMMAFYLITLPLLWFLLPSQHSIQRRLLDGLITASITLALYLPWALTSLVAQINMVQSGFWTPRPTFSSTMHLMAWLASVQNHWQWDHTLSLIHFPLQVHHTPTYLSLLLLFGAVPISLIKSDLPRRRNVLALMSVVLIPPLLATAWSLVSTPIVMDKTFLASAALAPLLLLFPLSILPPLSPAIRRSIAILVLLLAAGTLVGHYTSDRKEDWRGAAAWVKTNFPAPAYGQLILFVSNDAQLPFDYYYRNDDPVALAQTPPLTVESGSPAGFFDRNPPRAMLRVHQPADLAHLQSLIDHSQFPRIILVESHEDWDDPQNLTRQFLLQHYHEQQSRAFIGITIRILERNK